MSIDLVIITDVGAVDPDDVFSLILLPTLENINVKGVIASHFYIRQKAHLAKLILTELGKKNIPVYPGVAIDMKSNFDEKDRENFISNNELFPTLFGYPKHICKTERPWFPNFLKGYEDNYGSLTKDDYKVEKITGVEFLTNLLKNYSPHNKLVVACLSPMHDLALIPTELYPNMDLYAMGGGFEEDVVNFMKSGRTELNVEKAGYNWGITPKITQQVLDKLNASGQKLKLISSVLTF